jgi:hypothetical protein
MLACMYRRALKREKSEEFGGGGRGWGRRKGEMKEEDKAVDDRERRCLSFRNLRSPSFILIFIIIYKWIKFGTDIKALSEYEVSEKATRGGEWEPIKIPHENLAYIPNIKIRHALIPGKNGQVNSDKFSALVKSDEFSDLVKSDKMDQQNRTSFQPW